MPFYTYICDTCRETGVSIGDENPGTLSILRSIESRDEPLECPHCLTALRRAPAPEKFTALWGSKYSKKKTCLGPSVDYYPPTRERQRKKEMPTTHFSMSFDQKQELKKDAATAPSESERPSPGVSVKKE